MPFRVLGDDLVLSIEYLRVIQLRIFALDSLGLRMLEVFPNISGVEQSFGRDAPDQQAGSTQPGLLLD